MNKNVRPALACGHHKLINKLIVAGAAHSFLAQTEVKRIGEVGGIIRADINHHGQRLFRRDTGASRVKRKFANGNAHAVHTLISETQNALTVGDHNHFYVVTVNIFQNFQNLPLVLHRDKKASGLQKVVAKLLTSFTHRRRVDDRHDFFNVVAHDLVEQGFIRVMKRIKIEITLDGHRERAHEFNAATSLLF